MNNLVSGVRVICDVHEVFQHWRVNFFHLGGDVHTGDPHQLQELARDLNLLEVPIDEVNGEEEGGLLQSEFEVDLDQPVNEDGPHGAVDVLLDVHEGVLRLAHGAEDVVADLLGILRAVVDVFDVMPVRRREYVSILESREVFPELVYFLLGQ